ncbi:CCE_0567 family metalloprotein [Pseudanabaena sp. PCC 6802]|uniref:CCE_0567 family metalloprotein n=1 Tax=Pseudanabaena sp. PCC 6802 TaxID=118173 RepID=UPI00034BAF0F|nr:CCE_0567 family metalloprotein [Pseudanabaena sp. PCC 6802]
MVQVTDAIAVDEREQDITRLKTEIKRLNSKAGQLKMDLHDLAEGLPANYKQLMELAATTYDIYCQLDAMKQQLAALETQR